MAIRTIEDGIVRVTGTASMFCGLWVRGKARKPAFCHLSGRPILVGDLMYRPLTNGLDRPRRVLAEVMEKHARYNDRLFSRAPSSAARK